MATASTAPITILITDDHEQNRIFLTELIQSVRQHTTITEAADGETALLKVTDHLQQTGTSFDLIFMDYQMPGLNGQQTTKAIRQLEQKTPTAKPSMIITWSSAKNAPYPQADDWLTKFANQRDMTTLLTTIGFL